MKKVFRGCRAHMREKNDGYFWLNVSAISHVIFFTQFSRVFHDCFHAIFHACFHADLFHYVSRICFRSVTSTSAVGSPFAAIRFACDGSCNFIANVFMFPAMQKGFTRASWKKFVWEKSR